MMLYFLSEGINVKLKLVDGSVLAVEFPATIVCTVVETSADVKRINNGDADDSGEEAELPPLCHPTLFKRKLSLSQRIVRVDGTTTSQKYLA